MRNSVEARMQSIVADIFAIPEERITIDSSPDTIETWDSLQHLNLVLAVEQDFGVQFGPEEMEKLTTVSAFVETVQAKLARQSG
jgi:acyl carrier protein